MTLTAVGLHVTAVAAGRAAGRDPIESACRHGEKGERAPNRCIVWLNARSSKLAEVRLGRTEIDAAVRWNECRPDERSGGVVAGGIVLRASGAYAREGIHAYYFSAPGELILSTATETGVVRAMLTWKRRGDALHIEIQAAHLGG